MMNANRMMARRRQELLDEVNRRHRIREKVIRGILTGAAVAVGTAIWLWAAAASARSEAWAAGWESAGTYTITFYCPCRKCSGKYGYQTASGARCTEGRTIAVDRRVIPLGTRVMIDGHEYIAEDTGVRGKWIDVFMESHSECLRNGMKKKEVFIWR